MVLAEKRGWKAKTIKVRGKCGECDDWTTLEFSVQARDLHIPIRPAGDMEDQHKGQDMIICIFYIDDCFEGLTELL